MKPYAFKKKGDNEDPKKKLPNVLSGKKDAGSVGTPTQSER